MYKVMTHITETVQHALFVDIPCLFKFFHVIFFFFTLGGFLCFVNNCESLCVQYVLILLGHNIFKKASFVDAH